MDDKAPLARLELDQPSKGPSRGRRAGWLRRGTAFLAYNLAAVLLLFLLCEGAASFYYTFRTAFASPPVAERLYTEYDPELGWISRPDVDLPNMYGPGKFLRTDAQRFRNENDFGNPIPSGKTRIICSGDSFTLGFGVDNEHTWPHLLATQAANIETVNMGQGGYGADQAYLWYKRDGVKLDHDVQIFAVIYPDIYRMQHSSFVGYGKPMLVLKDGRISVANVPVARTTQGWSPREERLDNALSNLSITRLLQHAFKFGGTPFGAAAPATEQNTDTARVLLAVLDDLDRTNREKGSALVLAYLPIRNELNGVTASPWRKFLADYAHRHQVLYIDLTDDFRRLPAGEIDELFIGGRGDADFLGAEGHYTEAGNEFVATQIYRQLMAYPQTAAKLHASK